MGLDFASTEEMTGAIFIGAGSSMSTVWFVIAAVILVYAVWSGNRHEHKAYDKLRK